MTSKDNNSSTTAVSSKPKFLVIVTWPDYKRPAYRLNYVKNIANFIKKYKLDHFNLDDDLKMTYDTWCETHYQNYYMDNEPITVIEIVENQFIEWKREKIANLWNTTHPKF